MAASLSWAAFRSSPACFCSPASRASFSRAVPVHPSRFTRDQPKSRRAADTASQALTWQASRQKRSSRLEPASWMETSWLAPWTACTASSKGRAAVRVPNCTNISWVEAVSRGTSSPTQGARKARWAESFSSLAVRADTCRSPSSTAATAWFCSCSDWGRHSAS